MKISTFLLLLTMQLSAAISYSQEKVTLSLKEGKLTEVLKEIEGQTGYKVFYNNRLVEMAKPINVEMEEADLEEALNLIFKNQPLDYEIVEKTIVVKKKATKKKGKGDNASTTEYDFEDPVTVTGKVTDPEGLPLPGVTIRIKGTQQGTLTDSEGNYSITTEETNTLVFSFVGMVTMEEPIGSRTTINVSLQESSTQLQDVVVSGGYYETTERTKTGNIAKVAAKEIEKQPVTNPIMSLQGRIPGVDITPNTGIAGGAVNIQIRGQNSMRNTFSDNGNYPLYVIDGVPVDSRPLESASSVVRGGYDPLSMISPSNIESIEILKDADATAIYGSRGANGVVLITTKKGNFGEKTNLDVNIYHGVGSVENQLDLLNTEQYLHIRREGFANNNRAITLSRAPDLMLWDTTRYTNWQDVLLGGTANISDAQVSFSGGNSHTSFRIGGGFHKETMIFPGDFGFNRSNGHFSVNHISPNNKLTISASANLGVTNNRLFNDINVVSKALTLPPNAPELYNEDGTLNWEPDSPDPLSSTWTNPMSYFLKTNDSKMANLVFKGNIAYEVIDGLSIKANLGYTSLNGSEVLKTPINSSDPDYAPYITAEANFVDHKRNSWIFEPQANYNIERGDNSINILVGSTWQEGTSEYRSLRASGYSSDALLGSISGSASQTYLADNNNEYRYNSVFARLGYSFQDTYILNLTGRRDGSSRFGPANRFANFGSIGAAWIFSNENLFSNLAFVSFGKLRTSYGTTGSDQIGDYLYFESYSTTNNPYQGQTSLTPTSLFNPDFQWEITKKFELALETGLLENRVMFDVSWYSNRSSNQLISYLLPATSGFSSVTTNLDAVVENRGWEFTLASQNIKSGKLLWRTSLNLSIPTNKLVKFDNIEDSPYANSLVIGEPLTIRKLYTFDGVNPTTGLYEFIDENGDGQITIDDRQFIQNTGRKFYGGINNTISYNSFEFSFLLQFAKQTSLGYPFGVHGNERNVPQKVYNDHWIQEGDESSFQMSSSLASRVSTQYVNWSASNAVYEDASFIRLKTLTLSYTLPSQVIETLKLNDCNVFVQGQNLWTITNYEGIDPETGSSAVPPLRMLTGGIKITF